MGLVNREAAQEEPLKSFTFLYLNCRKRKYRKLYVSASNMLTLTLVRADSDQDSDGHRKTVQLIIRFTYSLIKSRSETQIQVQTSFIKNEFLVLTVFWKHLRVFRSVWSLQTCDQTQSEEYGSLRRPILKSNHLNKLTTNQTFHLCEIISIKNVISKWN